MTAGTLAAERCRPRPRGGKVLAGSGMSLDDLLWHAVIKRPTAPAKLILDAGVDPGTNAGRSSVYNLLETAIRAGDIEMVRVLIKAGADVNKSNSGSIPPIKTAKDLHFPAIVELLRAAGAKEP